MRLGLQSAVGLSLVVSGTPQRPVTEQAPSTVSGWSFQFNILWESSLVHLHAAPLEQ